MHKLINEINLALLVLTFGLSISVSIAQVPNGNFEEWQTLDSIENPLHWETNNYYVGYTPVAKTTDAIAGNYSMKVSSTARDIWGTATGDGCAHVKLVPTEEYQYLTASVRIDTVATGGEVSIRVKQWSPGSGLFEKIGTLKDTTSTNGVVRVVLPVEQAGLDTLLIEIWAKNYHDVLENPFGYTEMIVDSLQLTTTVAAQEPKNNFAWGIYPNPATDAINFRLSEPLQGQWSLAEISGQHIQTGAWSGKTLELSAEKLPAGIYFFQLRAEEGRVFAGKVVVQR